MNRIARRKTPLPDCKDTSTIRIYTADFGDGWDADIKVCNGDPPFIEPVLFRNGGEVMCLDVTDTLDGDYGFKVSAGEGVD